MKFWSTLNWCSYLKRDLEAATRGVLWKRVFLEISQTSQGNSCTRVLKKRLWHRCFPVNFVKFLRTPFLQNTFRRLLLEIVRKAWLHDCLFNEAVRYQLILTRNASKTIHFSETFIKKMKKLIFKTYFCLSSKNTTMFGTNHLLLF